jgi:hypothetical protein
MCTHSGRRPQVGGPPNEPVFVNLIMKTRKSKQQLWDCVLFCFMVSAKSSGTIAGFFLRNTQTPLQLYVLQGVCACWFFIPSIQIQILYNCVCLWLRMHCSTLFLSVCMCLCLSVCLSGGVFFTNQGGQRGAVWWCRRAPALPVPGKRRQCVGLIAPLRMGLGAPWLQGWCLRGAVWWCLRAPALPERTRRTRALASQAYFHALWRLCFFALEHGTRG